MRNYFKILIASFIAVSFIFAGCQQKNESPLLKEKFSTDNLPELIEKIKNDNDLTKQDIDLLNDGIKQNINRLDSINGKTLGDIIETRRELLRHLSINSFVNTAIALNVRSRYIGWVPDTTNKTGILAYKIYAKNISNKEITRIFGRLNFFTNQRQVMGVFNVNLKVKLPEQKETIIFAKISTQGNNAANVARIRNILETAPKTLFAQWQVLEIEFADGSVISLANKNKAKETE